MADQGYPPVSPPPPSYESAVKGDLSKSPVFEISVCDPVKQGEGVGAYVSFTIRTRTTMSNYKNAESEVIRRFRDFVWLADKLHEKNKGIIIPPLPEKNAVQKYQMSTDFIEQRRKALEVFVKRVAAHEVLMHSSELQLFLEATEDVWAMEVARMTQETSGTKNKVNAAVKMFKDTIHSAQSLIQGKSDDQQEDPEYLKIREYMNHLESHLTETHRQSARLIRKQGELGMAIGEFGNGVEKLGKFEEGDLNEAFTHLGKHSGDLSTAIRDSCKHMYQHFEAPMKEFMRMMKSIKMVIQDRSSALTALQQAKANLESLRVKLNKLRGTPGVREDRVLETEREVEAAEERVQNAKSDYENIVERMSEELGRFQKERAVEMSAVLRDFALAQAQLASQHAKDWGTLVTELQPAGAT